MKIIVTGAAGQVGSELVALSGEHDIMAFNHQELDIGNAARVSEVLSTVKADAVINAAAYTAVDDAETEQEKAFHANADGVKHLAVACSAMDIPLLHLSTDYVFDGTSDTPYTEEMPCSPLGIYGQSKWQGEHNIQSACIKFLILRTSWVFGQHGNNFVKRIVRVAQAQPELSVVDDQIGCPTEASDIAKTLLEIAKQIEAGNHAWGIYHYAGIPSVSWCEFAKEILSNMQEFVDVSSVKLKAITTEDYPTKAPRPKYSVLDCQKIQSTFGITPCVWQTRLRHILSTWYENNGNLSR